MEMNSEVNYSYWKKEYQNILESLSDKKVLLLFSGGKDSSIAMDLISKAGNEFGFDFEARAACYPVYRYNDTERKRIESYWSNRGVRIEWHDVGETDECMENAENPCHPCREVRRRLLKTSLKSSVDDWANLVLIVSFTLWDIVSYSLEHLLGDIFSDLDKGAGPEEINRFMETAQRFYPLLQMKEGYTIFRPLLKYNGSDTLKATNDKGIPILSTPCKFADYRPKRILEKYYDRMGLRFEYDRVLDFAKKSLNLPDITSYSSIAKEEYLTRVF